MRLSLLFVITYLLSIGTSFQLSSTPCQRSITFRSRRTSFLQMGKEKVIYQQVIRPRGTPKKESISFLPSLVNYIQSAFEIPKDLPMIYKATIPDQDDDEMKEITSSSNKKTYSILSLNSPLSRDLSATKLDIEVVGIYTEALQLPTMAMVVVKKMDISTDSSSVIMNRLFEDSEKKIIRALDRGLHDFMDGKYDSVDLDGDWSGIDDLSQYEGLEEDATLEDILMASNGINNGINIQDSRSDIVVDTVASNLKSSKGNQSETFSSYVGDFAVAAAKLAAEKTKQKKDFDSSLSPKIEKTSNLDSVEDFAVSAAKNAAAKMKEMKSNTNEINSKSLGATDSVNNIAIESKRENDKKSKKFPNVSKGSKVSIALPTTCESPMLKRLSSNVAGGFQVTISSPSTFHSKNHIFEEAITEKARKSISTKRDDKQSTFSLATEKIRDGMLLSEKERHQSIDATFSPVSEISFKSDDEIEHDILKAAVDLMPGHDDDQDNEMTTEELLKRILKFGDDLEKEEAHGANFAKAAVSKAKSLTEQERNTKFRELSENVRFPHDNLKNSDMAAELSAEQELKKIFAAGEKFAEREIMKSIADKNGETIVTEDFVDNLIAADTSVPRNARLIDVELSELEIRIAKRPGEDTDAFGPNPIFDVFSGPEIYNPNVDPETAVNWPGALPGTRTDIMLPPTLASAVKNAGFAAQLLSKMVEEEDGSNMKNFFIDGKKISSDQIEKLQRCVDEGVAIGLINDPIQYLREKSRLKMLVDELVRQPDERFGEIVVFYKDLLLSENFVMLLKDYLHSMAKDYLRNIQRNDEDADFVAQQSLERTLLGKLVKYAQLLLKETQALGAELEGAQLEIIRSICNVAMDPKHKTEQEIAEALTDAVRDLKPLLDENFVAYLKFAIAEEKGKLARSGLLDDPEFNRWLFVLEIVQEGVYSELSMGIRRYIDHISYVLRMKTKKERRQLLSKLIDKMPSMDIRPFVKVVDNIAFSLGQGVKGEFDLSVLGGFTNEILQMRKDVHDLLPSDRIQELSKEADEWAARQKEKLLKLRGISQQRLKASQETESYDQDFRVKGEVERFTF